eukprot:TRINITY_DN19090_c0_g2_i1.p1 TRINITY_DN19090_c0_g2~~TRINITY_DN19090_c0_g2_i1.p1  ORF type:complete len:193 (+),score=41.93 TRINITY_DN19090_c0_g2_i1:117-695(+)
MIRRPPRSTLSSSSAASDVYKRQVSTQSTGKEIRAMPTTTAMERTRDRMNRLESDLVHEAVWREGDRFHREVQFDHWAGCRQMEHARQMEQHAHSHMQARALENNRRIARSRHDVATRRLTSGAYPSGSTGPVMEECNHLLGRGGSSMDYSLHLPLQVPLRVLPGFTPYRGVESVRAEENLRRWTGLYSSAF